MFPLVKVPFIGLFLTQPQICENEAGLQAEMSLKSKIKSINLTHTEMQLEKALQIFFRSETEAKTSG